MFLEISPFLVFSELSPIPEFSELSPILLSPQFRDVFLCSRFGDTYTIMLHVCGPSARSGKIFELVQSYFPGASIRVSTKPITLNCLNLCLTTFCIIMDFPIHTGTESMGLTILYFKVSQVEVSILCCVWCFNLSKQCRS